MAAPTLLSVTPNHGASSGGDLVRVVGTAFAANAEVLFGEVSASVVSLREEAGQSIADVRSPAHEAGSVDITVRNRDSVDVIIAGEVAQLANAYRFLRAALVEQSDLARLVRQLLRELKRQVVTNVSATVSVDYDDTPDDGVIAMAAVPSLVLSGPMIRQNRLYSSNLSLEEVVSASTGLELSRRRPPLTVDLVFTITAASARTVELLNLMVAIATFLNRNRWISLPRDPAATDSELVRWELDADGELRTQLNGSGDVRAFTWGLVVRGFDIDEGQVLDRGRAVVDTELEILPIRVPLS
jgi:hypothetical protein